MYPEPLQQSGFNLLLGQVGVAVGFKQTGAGGQQGAAAVAFDAASLQNQPLGLQSGGPKSTG